MTALKPIKWIIEGLEKITGYKIGGGFNFGNVGSLGNMGGAGLKTFAAAPAPVYNPPIFANNPAVKNTQFGGRIEVVSTLNNNTSYPASTSLGLMGDNNMVLKPAQ